MAGELPWYPMYASVLENDFRFRRMDLVAQAVYMRLLNVMWAEGKDCSLPLDHEALRKYFGLSKTKWKIVWVQMNLESDPIFKIENGVFYSSRLRDEWRKRLEISNISRKKALKRWGANAMPGHSCGNAGGDADSMPEVCRDDAIKNKNKSTKKIPPASPPLFGNCEGGGALDSSLPSRGEVAREEQVASASPPLDAKTKAGFPRWENLPWAAGVKKYPELFEEIWRIHPVGDKGKAYERWCRVMKARTNGAGPGPPAQSLMWGLEVYLAECRADQRFRRQGGRKTQNLETWLNWTWEQYWGKRPADVGGGTLLGKVQNEYSEFD